MKTKKLSLSRETLRHLNRDQLARAGGAGLDTITGHSEPFCVPNTYWCTVGCGSLECTFPGSAICQSRVCPKAP
jgi:hypothetical protein